MTRECEACGEYVSDAYFRVFSVDGVLHGCQSCERVNNDHRPGGNVDTGRAKQW